MEGLIFAIDLGGTSTKLAILTNEGGFVHKWLIPKDTSEKGQNILPHIKEAFYHILIELDLNLEQFIGCLLYTSDAADDRMYVYDFLTVFPARIVTNSIHVFNRFNKNEGYDLILIGGSYRARTGAFVGSFANNTLKKINVKKAFIGANGVHGNEVYTANEEEGITQSIILDNAHEKYIVADYSKIWGQDFFSFYHLDGINRITYSIYYCFYCS
ncbi:hypothetical protein [Staphylococcus aureus]